MKVLFIGGADQKYGTQHMAKNIMKYVMEYYNGIEFVLLTQKTGILNEWCDEHGIENYTVPYRYCVYYPPNNKLIAFLKRTFKKFYVLISNYTALKKIEKLHILDSIDIIHTNHNRDLFGMMISKKYKIPNITHLREFSRAHFHLDFLYKNQMDFMNRNTVRFVAISDAVKKDWTEYGIGESKTVMIYDGIDSDRIRSACCINDNKILRIIMNGAIYEGKGQFELVKAISVLIDNGLIVNADFFGENVSKDGYFENICEYVKENNLGEFIKFNGYCNNLYDILSDYDVGVVCSKSEGFGLVTVEYLMAGLSVIVSDTGANKEIICNGKYGYIYELGNIEQLSSILMMIYKKKLDCSVNSADASAYAKEKYSAKENALKIGRLYYDVYKEYEE